MENCSICKRIDHIHEGTNPNFIAELSTGFLVLADSQFFPGYSLFLSRWCEPELFSLEQSIRRDFLFEMSCCAQAINIAFTPRKMNYEMLGNQDRHMHWHLFPRYETEEKKLAPAWQYPPEVFRDTYAGDATTRAKRIQFILGALRETGITIVTSA